MSTPQLLLLLLACGLGFAFLLGFCVGAMVYEDPMPKRKPRRPWGLS